MKIHSRILLAFLIIAPTVGIVSYLEYSYSNQLHVNYNALSNDFFGATMLDRMKTLVQATEMDAGNIALGTLSQDILNDEISEMKENKAKYNDAITDYVKHIDLGDPDDKKFLDSIQQNGNELFATSFSLVDESKIKSEKISQLSEQLHKTNTQFIESIDAAITAEQGKIEKRQLQVDNINKTITLLSVVGSTAVVAEILIIGFLMSRSIVTPVRRLESASNEIAKGNYEYDIVSNGTDEIANLITRFNEMRKFIKSTNEHLNDLVNERTKELEDKTKRVERLARIGELASRLAHNLRNPLSVIHATIGIINATSKDKLDTQTQERLLRIENASKNMLKQIEDVLSFVKNKPLDIQPTSLTTILQSAISNLEKPVDVKIIMPDEEIHLKCDAEKFQVVFMNLITNAVQAMGTKGEVILRGIYSGKDVIIEVEDSGPGIPANVLPRIFDSLFTTKESGTGLGLSYCKDIVEQHGGHIIIKTCPTVFSILLPNSAIITEASNNMKTKI